MISNIHEIEMKMNENQNGEHSLAAAEKECLKRLVNLKQKVRGGISMGNGGFGIILVFIFTNWITAD